MEHLRILPRMVATLSAPLVVAVLSGCAPGNSDLY